VRFKDAIDFERLSASMKLLQSPIPRSINIPERCILMHFQQHIHELKESKKALNSLMTLKAHSSKCEKYSQKKDKLNG
jgi:hypothetical protein